MLTACLEDAAAIREVGDGNNSPCDPPFALKNGQLSDNLLGGE